MYSIVYTLDLYSCVYMHEVITVKNTGQATVAWLSNEHNDGATYSDPSYVKQQVPMETSKQTPFHEEQSSINHHPLGTSTYPLLHLYYSLISHVLCISMILKIYVCTHRSYCFVHLIF